MGSTITIDVRALYVPTDNYVDILTSGDYYPSQHLRHGPQYGTLIGPEDAFKFKAGPIRDKVKVIKPELVEIQAKGVL